MTACSAVRASLRACAKRVAASALTLGLTACICAIQASNSSTGETWRLAIRRLASTADNVFNATESICGLSRLMIEGRSARFSLKPALRVEPLVHVLNHGVAGIFQVATGLRIYGVDIARLVGREKSCMLAIVRCHDVFIHMHRKTHVRTRRERKRFAHVEEARVRLALHQMRVEVLVQQRP